MEVSSCEYHTHTSGACENLNVCIQEDFDELKMLEKKLNKSLKQTSGTEQAKSKLRDSARESYNDGGARRKSASWSIPSQGNK